MLVVQMYHSYELETLRVAESIKRFRVYLTDCNAVKATLLKKELVKYRAGKNKQHVDALRDGVLLQRISNGSIG